MSNHVATNSVMESLNDSQRQRHGCSRRILSHHVSFGIRFLRCVMDRAGFDSRLTGRLTPNTRRHRLARLLCAFPSTPPIHNQPVRNQTASTVTVSTDSASHQSRPPASCGSPGCWSVPATPGRSVSFSLPGRCPASRLSVAAESLCHRRRVGCFTPTPLAVMSGVLRCHHTIQTTRG